jgi:hypothetical protein
VYYVYEHWRPDRDEPFYVGKGRGYRANLMARRNPHHTAIQKKLHNLGMAVEVRIIASNLTEEEAFRIEVERIKMWQTAGIDLANKTLGGEGVPGLIFSSEHRKKLGNTWRGKKRPPMSEEQKKKISIARKGIKSRLGAKLSEETKLKISLSNKGISRGKGKTISASTREKISKSLSISIRGEKNPFWGKNHTEETKKKLSDGVSGEKHHFYGKNHSEETKKKMKLAWERRRQRATSDN